MTDFTCLASGLRSEELASRARLSNPKRSARRRTAALRPRRIARLDRPLRLPFKSLSGAESEVRSFVQRARMQHRRR